MRSVACVAGDRWRRRRRGRGRLILLKRALRGFVRPGLRGAWVHACCGPGGGRKRVRWLGEVVGNAHVQTIGAPGAWRFSVWSFRTQLAGMIRYMWVAK